MDNLFMSIIMLARASNVNARSVDLFALDTSYDNERAHAFLFRLTGWGTVVKLDVNNTGD
jgi:hypothetical protein